FKVETERFSSGRGIPKLLEALVEGDVDAVILFSESAKAYLTNNRNAAQQEASTGLTVSNPGLGAPHLLGTDTPDRDIASHIVHGGTTLITTALVAGLLSTLIAVTLGSLAALMGGIIDNVLTAIANL